MRRKNPQARYEICKDCGREWNISIEQKIPLGGYLCPHCAAKYRPSRWELNHNTKGEHHETNL